MSGDIRELSPFVTRLELHAVVFDKWRGGLNNPLAPFDLGAIYDTP